MASTERTYPSFPLVVQGVDVKRLGNARNEHVLRDVALRGSYLSTKNVLRLLNMTRGNMQYPRTLAVFGMSTPWGDMRFKIRYNTEQPTTATP